MSVPSSDLPAAAASTTSSGFADGLGRRSLAFDREEGTMLERLTVRPELAAFEKVLRERVERAGVIEDQRIARPRGLERAGDGGLVVVSEFVPGTRLSDLLDACAQTGIAPGVDAALGYLLDVLPALCGLHAGAGFAHGTIAPSRTVLTPAGEVVLLDAIYGGAVSYLRYGRQRLWTDFGIATPSTGGTPRLDVQTDIAQVALSAMLLVLGRPLADHEYPKGLQSVIGEVVDVAQIRGTPEFAEGLLEFLERTLQVNDADPFATADDALIEIRGLAQEIGLQVCRQALVDLIQQAECLTDAGGEEDPAVTGIEPEIDGIVPKIDGIVPEIEGLVPEIDGIIPEILAVYPEDDIDLAQGRAFESDVDPVVDAEIDLDTLVEAPQEEPVLLAWPTRSGPTTPALEAALEAVGVQGDFVEPPSPEPAAIEPEPPAAAALPEVETTPPVTMPIASRAPAAIEEQPPAAEEVAAVKTAPPGRMPIEQPSPAASEPEPAAKEAAEIETTPAATVPIEPPPAPPSVRSKRAKRARSSRARKDKLRSAAAAATVAPIAEKSIAEKKAPAEAPTPPEPEKPEKPAKTTGWLVPPDTAAAFEPPVPEPALGPAPVIGAPVPASASPVPAFAPPMPAPFSGPAVPAAPPPPPGVAQYPPAVPLQPAGAPSMDALARAQAPVIYPPINPGYAPPPPWTPPPPATPASVAPAPVAPAPIALAEQTPQRPKPLKLKEPTRRPQPAPVAPRDIYSQPPPSTPRDSAGEFPWKVAIGALVLVAAVIAGGRAMLWTERKADGQSAQEAVAATPDATKLPAVAGATGRIEIETQPAGARVLLDGKPAGEAPLTIDAVPVGRHTVTLVSSAGTVKKTVRVQAGRTAKLDVPIFSGWVGVFAPFVVEVSENGTVIGTTEDPRLMLPPGRHELTLTNKALGYRSVQTVEIEPGQTRSLRLDPRGTVNFNAIPWAEVWIEGKKIGDTPIANQSMPLGIHEIVFKHPDLGERRVPVTVRGDVPAAVSVDMTAR